MYSTSTQLKQVVLPATVIYFSFFYSIVEHADRISRDILGRKWISRSPETEITNGWEKIVEDHKWLWRTTKLLNFLNRLERPSPLSIPRIPSYSIQRAYKQLSFVILFASLLSYSDHPACRKKGWISVFLITFVRRKINFLPQYADATWKDGTKQSPQAKHHSVFCTNTRLCKIM